MAYHQRYIEKLKTFCSIEGKDVAVLGCSFGHECQLFVNEGANAVVGFDKDPEIGREFSHAAVTYRRESVHETGCSDGTFDIVFSAAVFEHVQDVAGGFSEAARICRKNGVVMIVSSPLWHSPYGNHLGRFLEEMPWCHLLFTPKTLVLEIEKRKPQLLDEPARIEWMVERIFDPVYFNRYPPVVYMQAVSELEGIQVRRNAVWPAQVKDEYKNHYLPQCLKHGFDPADLMSGAHFFVGRK